jgi:dihydroorotate dehydrogenase (NAD+) catalytic subunit
VTREAIRAFGTTFQNPILLASGTAGFGREVADVIDLERLGGIVTKSVSLEPRAGHPAPRLAEFAAGMLNAVGLANPGLEQVVAVELPWLRTHLRCARVLVSVVGDTAAEFAAVLARLDGTPDIVAFELNVSCPNTERGGEEFCADRGVLADVVARCRAATRRPLVVKLPPTVNDLPATAAAAAAAGADGFTLVNTIPGTLYRLPARRSSAPMARLGYGQGGVSGPALLPVGVLAVRRVRERTALPLIGVGGVRTPDDVEQYLGAGATLVAVGTAALAEPRLPERLAAVWRRGG